MVERVQDGIRWELAPAFAPLLDAILADRGRPVKQTPTKLVSVHDIDGRTYYVKRYRNFAVPLRPLKYWFKPSEARNEWRLARQYSALGIPLVEHLALGERWGVAGLLESILITEGFDGIPLSKCRDHQSPAVQIALAKLLRLMHDRGVLQPDLHHNILVRAEPLELRRIDVDRGELRHALTDAERIDNLAYLNIFVPLGEHFFETYGGDIALAQRVRQRSLLIRRRLAARRSRRCLETNLRFESYKLGGLKWWVRLEFFDDKLRRLLENPDAALESCPMLYKSGPNRQSTIGSFDGLVLKRFNIKNRWNYLKDLFRPSRALRSYRKAYHLELLGMPTPRPVAAAERRMMRVLINSYLVMEEIRGAQDLRTLKALSIHDAREAGRLVGRLHDDGFAHGDLKETNIVRDAEGKLFLLDLDGLTYLQRLPEQSAAADLARLARGAANYPAVTALHRFAFVRAYCKTRGLKRVPRRQSR